LQLLLKNEDARWTSDTQAQVFSHALPRQSLLLVVIPTSRGKLVLFAAMPYIEQGVTVVCFPLHALMLDQVAVSIQRDPARPFKIWLTVKRGVVADLIEHAGTPAFLHWCYRMNNDSLLSCIVLDEGHIIAAFTTFHHAMNNLLSVCIQRFPWCAYLQPCWLCTNLFCALYWAHPPLL
jgi:hypothetical protein